MRELLRAKQMKECDRYTIEEMDVPSLVLMERAALACVEVLKCKDYNLKKSLVVCGTGNNGGDGVAIARLLHLAGYKAYVFLAGNPAKRSEELKIQLKIAENYGVTVVQDFKTDEYTTIVDAVFGIGLSREVSGEYKSLLEKINESSAKVLAVDIPSGVHSDTGAILTTAVRAADTVTFAYGKPGLYLYPGAGCVGRIHTADIGIYLAKQKGDCFLSEEKDLSVIRKRRRSDGNKGSFGKVFLLAGSPQMSGAALMAARAAYRTGSGMVKLHTASENRAAVQSALSEVMTSFYKMEDICSEEIEKGLAWCDAAAIGPGIGTGAAARRMLRLFLSKCKKPCVIDADALNLISEEIGLLKSVSSLCTVTPHMGEMSRLTGIPVPYLKADPIKAALDFAKEYKVICVLKDARTVTAFPDGRSYLNSAGNNGMATAGSGDVLTGILAGLLGQAAAGGYPLMEEIPRGVLLHGAAGDAAALKTGTVSLMATDIIKELFH